MGYANLLAHRDDNHLPVFKTRRSFLYENQQYQLDIYRAPCHSRCQGLILLETYTTSSDDELVDSLPPFLAMKKKRNMFTMLVRLPRALSRWERRRQSWMLA